MTLNDKTNITGTARDERQPTELATLLMALNAARRQVALYGADHPNAGQSASDLAVKSKSFFDVFGRSTLVFTKDAVLVNEHSYAGSADSKELFDRIRSRGVMAVTIVAPPPADQISAVIRFLNADPSEVRDAGGASAYLRKQSVTLLVATDAVYASGDCPEDAEDATQQPAASPEDMDRALGAAIDWLLKQDAEDDETPRLPITEILSQPDEAAKLIREAVTKLHASRRQETRGEIASEVVHDLKDLAVDEPEKWDSATPQIRKAMSKLPKGMRPVVAGFTEDEDDLAQDGPAPGRQIADTLEIEAQIADVLADSLVPGYKGSLPPPDAFGWLFGASPCGLLSSWRRELQPGMVMSSSGRTLRTLMVQENRAIEHERLTRALASLLPRAVEMKDSASALAIAEALSREMKHGDPQDWRAINARAALQSLDKNMLKTVVQAAAASTDAEVKRSACELVEALPELALKMVGILGSREIGEINQSLIRGVVKCGVAAMGPLGSILEIGSDAARELALDALVEMNSGSAVREIVRALPRADDAFVMRALRKLSAIRHPEAVDICVDFLGSRTSGVRCAALAALGQFAVPTTVPALIRAASRPGLSEDDVEEKKLALEALSQIASADASDFLEKTAKRNPLLGRRRYEPIRATAEHLLMKKTA